MSPIQIAKVLRSIASVSFGEDRQACHEAAAILDPSGERRILKAAEARRKERKRSRAQRWDDLPFSDGGQ